MPRFAEAMNLGDLLKYEAPEPLLARPRHRRLRPEPAAGHGRRHRHRHGQGQTDRPRPPTDGTQVAAGVLLQACDATLADRDDGLVVARHAIVADHALRVARPPSPLPSKQAAIARSSRRWASSSAKESDHAEHLRKPAFRCRR